MAMFRRGVRLCHWWPSFCRGTEHSWKWHRLWHTPRLHRATYTAPQAWAHHVSPCRTSIGVEVICRGTKLIGGGAGLYALDFGPLDQHLKECCSRATLRGPQLLSDLRVSLQGFPQLFWFVPTGHQRRHRFHLELLCHLACVECEWALNYPRTFPENTHHTLRQYRWIRAANSTTDRDTIECNLTENTFDNSPGNILDKRRYLISGKTYWIWERYFSRGRPSEGFL